MKKIILILSCFSILLVNCKSDVKSDAKPNVTSNVIPNQKSDTKPVSKPMATSDVLTGTWKVTDYDSQLQGIPDNVLQSAKNKTLTSSYTFNDDGTFILRSASVPNGNTGNYSYSKEANILELNYFVSGKQTKVIYQLEEVNATTTKWIQDMNQIGKIFITLKKQ